jgi:YfiH family protein
MNEPFTLEWRETDALRWLQWEGAGVAAAFPTRDGGVSPAPFDSLNLGLSTDDAPVNVLENRRRLCAAVGVPQERLVVPGQVHGTGLAWVGDADAGRGAFDRETVIHDHDGLLTSAAGMGLAVSYADCVPVVIVARGADGPELTAVHAGWRGMLAGIVGQAAEALAHRGRLVGAVVGPSIGPCCFTVDEGLRSRFDTRFPGSVADGAVDLWACARRDLEAAGVPPAAVSVAALCTADDVRFFSHRRDHGMTGRHLAIAWRQEA